MKKIHVFIAIAIIILNGCSSILSTYEVTSGSEIDVTATLVTTNDGGEQSIKVVVEAEDSAIQMSNGKVYYNGTVELEFDTDLVAYYSSSISLSDDETCTISIVLNEGDSDELTYDDTTITYLGSPEITAKMGSSYSSLGDEVTFPTSIDNTNGMNIIVESSYTATAGEVTRTYETATSTDAYDEMNDRYFTPKLISGSDIGVTVTSIDFEFTAESSGSIDTSFNSGSAVSQVVVSKTLTVNSD